MVKKSEMEQIDPRLVFGRGLPKLWAIIGKQKRAVTRLHSDNADAFLWSIKTLARQTEVQNRQFFLDYFDSRFLHRLAAMPSSNPTPTIIIRRPGFDSEYLKAIQKKGNNHGED